MSKQFHSALEALIDYAGGNGILQDLFNDDALLNKADWVRRLSTKSPDGRRVSFVNSWLRCQEASNMLNEDKTNKATSVHQIIDDEVKDELARKYALGATPFRCVVDFDSDRTINVVNIIVPDNNTKRRIEKKIKERGAFVYATRIQSEEAAAKEALNKCIQHLIDELNDNNPFIEGIYSDQEIETQLIPAMQAGFVCERYSPAVIASFVQGLQVEIGKDDSLKVMQRIVAGAMFGPADTLANPDERRETEIQPADTFSGKVAIDYKSIQLTHVYDEGARIIGMSLSVNNTDGIVLIGRMDEEDLEDWREGNEDPYERVRGMEIVEKLEESTGVSLGDARALYIPEHKRFHSRVSRIHGLIAYNDENEAWYFYDLCSACGTIVSNEDAAFPVLDSPICLKPGDSVHLGVARDKLEEVLEPAAAAQRMSSLSSEQVYLNPGATILVSMGVDWVAHGMDDENA